jgi:hypothetical protein
MRNNFFNEVAIILKDTEYNEIEEGVSQKYHKSLERNI